MKLDGLLGTIDIQKAFDSVDHSFLISTLEKYEWKFYSKTKNQLLMAAILLNTLNLRKVKGKEI